jgi:hypothetical protein
LVRIEGLGAILPRMLVQAIGRPAPAMATLGDQTPRPDTALQPNALANPAIGSVQMLVAMSAQTPVEERRRRTVQRATRGLDALAALDAAAMIDAPRTAVVASLTEWSQELHEAADPALDALMAEIELRVRVELAKYDREV